MNSIEKFNSLRDQMFKDRLIRMDFFLFVILGMFYNSNILCNDAVYHILEYVKYDVLTDDNVHQAVKDYYGDEKSRKYVLFTYGHITYWKVSCVTDMGKLFKNCTKITNENLNYWDVSNVRSMNHMFDGAIYFNGNISGWNVGNVRNMTHMFRCSASFDGNISRWNVKNVHDMYSMFECADKFNSDISRWNVEKVRIMRRMFWGALKFNCDISGWNFWKYVDQNDMLEGTVVSLKKIYPNEN